MHWRFMTLGAAGIASMLSTNFMLSQPVEARSACMYVARDLGGRIIADGDAWAAKKSWACNRARRRCSRELNRKRRQGKRSTRDGCVRAPHF